MEERNQLKNKLIANLLELTYMHNELVEADCVAIGKSKADQGASQRFGSIQMFHAQVTTVSKIDEQNVETLPALLQRLSIEYKNSILKHIDKLMNKVKYSLNEYSYQADGRICCCCGTNVFVRNNKCFNGHSDQWVGFEHLRSTNTVESIEMQNAISMLGLSREVIRRAIINTHSLEDYARWKRSGYISINENIPLQAEHVHVLRNDEETDRLIPDTLMLFQQPDDELYWIGEPKIGARVYDFHVVKFWMPVILPQYKFKNHE